MNYSMVLYVVGWILNFEAAFMLPSCLVACIYQEKKRSGLCSCHGGCACGRGFH